MFRICGSLSILVALFGCTEPNPSANGGDTTSAMGVGGTTVAHRATAGSMTDGPQTTSTTNSGAMTSDAPATTLMATSGATVATGDVMTGSSGSDTSLSGGGGMMTSSGTEGVTSTGEPPVCPAETHTCANLAPDGWSGPSAVIAGNAAAVLPSCGDGYPDQSLVAYDGVQASPAQCGCSCNVTSATCANEIAIRHWATTNCLGISDFLWAHASAGCNDAIGVNRGSYTASRPAFTGGACTAVPTEIIADASFDLYVACDSTTNDVGDCSVGQRCLPTPADPYDGRICIWTRGDQECPAGLGYAQRSVYYQDLADTRDCSSCSCGSISGTCSGGTVRYANAECGGLLLDWVDAPANGSCHAGPSLVGSTSVLLFNVTANASCPASGGDPIGDVTETDPVTFCCQTPG